MFPIECEIILEAVRLIRENKGDDFVLRDQLALIKFNTRQIQHTEKNIRTNKCHITE